MQSVLVDEEGVTPGSAPRVNTQSNEGEPNLYSNEEEKELYTFLCNNNLLILYDKLKVFALYMDQLQTVNVHHSEFDDLCSKSCLELTDKPHIKIRLKTAIQSLKSELRIGAIAPPDIRENIVPPSLDHAHAYAPPPLLPLPPPHFYPPPGMNREDNPLPPMVNNRRLVEEDEPPPPRLNPGPGAAPPQHVYPSPVAYVNKPKDKKPFVNSAYRIMVFLRIILEIMDLFVIQPAIESKSIIIGGPFGSFLLFVMSISGMYNICKHPISKKSGSLSVLLAATELFYFASRDGLSLICYEELYRESMQHFTVQLYNFGIHAMMNMVLACCLGRIIWQYRSEIFAQIHSSKWNAICNYLVFGWVISWELDSLHGIVFGNGENAQISTQVTKMLNIWNVFFCTETSFLLGVIFFAPPIKP